MARHMSRRHRRSISRISVPHATLSVAGLIFLFGVLVALRTVLG